MSAVRSIGSPAWPSPWFRWVWPFSWCVDVEFEKELRVGFQPTEMQWMSGMREGLHRLEEIECRSRDIKDKDP